MRTSCQIPNLTPSLLVLLETVLVCTALNPKLSNSRLITSAWQEIAEGDKQTDRREWAWGKMWQCGDVAMQIFSKSFASSPRLVNVRNANGRKSEEKCVLCMEESPTCPPVCSPYSLFGLILFCLT